MLKLKKEKEIRIFTLFLVIVIVAFFYRSVPQVFFQQDEWFVFGKILLHGFGYGWAKIPTFELLPRPLSRFFTYLLFSIIGTNAFWYGVLSLFLHLLNVCLLWFFLRRFTKSWIVASAGALFFGVNAVGSQAVTWFADFPGTLPAVAFTLLTLIFYDKFRKTQLRKWLMVAVLSFLAAVLFKEITFFLLFFIPIFDLMLQEDKNLKAMLGRTWIFWGLGGIMLGQRLLEVFLLEGKIMRFVTGENSLLKVLLNLITYPVEGIFQILFPADLTFRFTHKLLPVWFPWLSNNVNLSLISQSVGGEMLCFLAGIILWLSILILISFWRREGRLKIFRQIFLAACFLGLSFFPYVLLNKPDAYLESRYYYLPTMGMSWLMVTVISAFSVLSGKTLKKILILSSFVFLTLIQVKFLNSSLQELVETSETRKFFLQQILKDYPQLPRRVAFFFISLDKDSGKFEKPELPFQSGLGQTLMVFYSERGQLNPLFFENEFLWDIDSQGYREIEGRGFGYFYELSEIQKAIYRNRLSLEDIFVYDWNKKEQRLTNISQSAKIEILGNQIRITEKDNWKIKPYVETESAQAMIDDDFETSWSNLTAYQQGQKIEIDLGILNELTGVVLFYPDNNQVNMFAAGYKIEVSKDSKAWTTVFEKVPFYQGKWVEMFFEPIPGQYIRITQLGTHAVVYWSIAEVDIHANSSVL